MKINRTLIFAGIAVALLALVVVYYTKDALPTAPASSQLVQIVPPPALSDVTAPSATITCPYIFSQSSGFKMTAYDCTHDLETDGTPMPYDYTAHNVTIESLDGVAKQTFHTDIGFESVTSNMGQITPDSNDSYVFYDEGSWLIHSITIFSMTDGRTTNIEYHDFKLTDNGYILYSPRSTTYSDAHPEVDMSAALDVDAMRLSDFSIQNLCSGDVNYDCQIGAVSADGTKIAIEKVKWNTDPAQTKLVSYFPIK